MEDAVSRKEEIKDQVRKGKYFAERGKYPTTFDELIQKYKEIFKDQKCFGRAKKFALKSIDKYFSGRLLSQITPYDIESYKRLKRKPPSPLLERKEMFGSNWIPKGSEAMHQLIVNWPVSLIFSAKRWNGR